MRGDVGPARVYYNDEWTHTLRVAGADINKVSNACVVHVTTNDPFSIKSLEQQHCRIKKMELRKYHLYTYANAVDAICNGGK